MNLLTKFSVGQYVHGNRSWLRIIDSRLKIIIVMIFLVTPIWAGPIWRLGHKYVTRNSMTRIVFLQNSTVD